ncbi:NAD(P)-dependent oxidoreductase [Granulicella sibirica]|uniref:Flavin reductase n=1 Tax=Granulicella sibirica TaxID=2479048 RepID=A0A4Q0T414_9BACT|nr:NAD(P)H-binding protein [Granulicella sibirica]RXH58383.1 Flavin reductase [Granulicella sibirica]
MKVLVIGAAGKTGRLVAERALAAGHQVTGLVHSDDPKEEEKHPYPAGMEVVHGDVRNPSRLETAMEGHNAVIDTLGGKTPFKETDLESSAARVVIEVMGKVGAKRLIVISVLGVGDSKEQAGFFYEHLMMPTFLRGALKDKEAMEEEVKRSGLEWVLVRPPVLSDSDATGSVKVVPAGEMAHKITRGDLAQFLVEQLTSDVYLEQAVTVANS